MTEQLADMRRATLEVAVLAALTGLLEEGHPLVVAYSGGKDSSVLANLALNAGRMARTGGGRVPPIVVTHADVGSVENPEIRALVSGEMAKMQRFASAQGIALIVRVSPGPRRPRAAMPRR